MRLGGPVFNTSSPEEWAAAHISAGYRAAYAPNVPEADESAYVAAAKAADVVIAEVGAWSNPLSPDDKARAEALKRCKGGLAKADRIGARCCVNIAGSRGEKWDGPCSDDFSADTFTMIVDTVREIIDDVKPVRTTYTLEVMPWMLPDSAESYLELISAIDRPAFGVHFDPVNMINCPRRYYSNGASIADFVKLLAPHIRSCHAKDILIGQTLTLHLSEVTPGDGALDYGAFLRAMSTCDPDMPIMMEHLSAELYPKAAAHIREIASHEGLAL